MTRSGTSCCFVGKIRTAVLHQRIHAFLHPLVISSMPCVLISAFLLLFIVSSILGGTCFEGVIGRLLREELEFCYLFDYILLIILSYCHKARRAVGNLNLVKKPDISLAQPEEPLYPADDIYGIVGDNVKKNYDIREVTQLVQSKMKLQSYCN